MNDTTAASGAKALSDAEARYPIGTEVTYYPVKPFRADEAFHTRVRSEPWALGHGDIVVKVEGKAGGVSIEHLVLRSAP